MKQAITVTVILRSDSTASTNIPYYKEQIFWRSTYPHIIYFKLLNYHAILENGKHSLDKK